MRVWKDITKPLAERQLDYLDYTVKYYTEDGNERSVTSSGGCYYFKDGKKCGIGKDIPEETAKFLDKSTIFSSSGVDENNIFRQLPDTLKTLTQKFLIQIQSLHDESENWENDNEKLMLSSDGIMAYESIIRHIN